MKMIRDIWRQFLITVTYIPRLLLIIFFQWAGFIFIYIPPFSKNAIDYSLVCSVMISLFVLFRLCSMARAYQNRNLSLDFPVSAALIVIANLIIIYAAYYYYDAFIGESAKFVDYLYFSIVTFTTLGYGDIVPPNDIRLLASSEALVGYLSLAVMISIFLAIISQDQKRFESSIDDSLRKDKRKKKKKN